MQKAGWLDQSKALSVETHTWLLESDFFDPPKENSDNLIRKLTPRRHAATTFVALDEDDRAVNVSALGEGINEQDQTTQFIEAATSTPAPKVSEEIFIKGEDLPGGVDGDTTIVTESWRVHYAPVWQVSPPPRDPTLINYNFLGDATSGGTFNAIQVSGNK